jgi:hypothetical protein
MQTLKLLIFEYFQKLVPHIGDLLEQGEQVRTGTSNSLPHVKSLALSQGRCQDVAFGGEVGGL